MAKTYTAAGSATAGEVYTASAHNIIVTDVNNLIVPPAVRVVRSTDQSVNNTTNTNISFGTTPDFDTDGMFSSGSADRITIQTAGLYQLNAHAIFSVVSATGTRYMALLKNGSPTSLSATPVASESPGNGSGFTEATISATVSLAASDYIQVRLYHGAGVAVNCKGSLSAVWIGRTS